MDYSEGFIFFDWKHWKGLHVIERTVKRVSIQNVEHSV